MPPSSLALCCEFTHANCFHFALFTEALIFADMVGTQVGSFGFPAAAGKLPNAGGKHHIPITPVPSSSSPLTAWPVPAPG